jgi:L-2-hydroxycarboxylate dehydrogenase (NAD+)
LTGRHRPERLGCGADGRDAVPDVAIAELRERAAERLRQEGVPEQDARLLVEHMLTADLWGRPTHGLSTRFALVLKQAEEGRARRRHAIVRDGGTHVLVDGCNGFGYSQASVCTDLLVERVGACGLCTVALRNTGHTGLLGYYADRGARANVVTLAFSHCCPLMAPYGGARALLGTNPVAAAFPADPDPILVDTGTAAVTYGEAAVCRREGRALRPGCALDADGNPTTDPAAAREGCLLPFGDHRGGALAVAVQLLAGAFTGSDAIPPPGSGYGLLMIGFRKDLFADAAAYERGIRDFTDAYTATPAQPGHTVRLPGSGRYRALREQRDRPLSISPQLAELLDIRGE